MTWRIGQCLLVSLLLVLARPAHALVACGAITKGTTQLKDGSSVKLRAVCKSKERAIDLFALVLAGPGTCTSQELTDAQALQQTAQARFQAGQALVTEVQLANVWLADVQFCAGQTAQADYCASIVPLLAAVVSARTTQYQNALVSIDQVIAARKTLLEKRAFCASA